MAEKRVQNVQVTGNANFFGDIRGAKSVSIGHFTALEVAEEAVDLARLRELRAAIARDTSMSETQKSEAERILEQLEVLADDESSDPGIIRKLLNRLGGISVDLSVLAAKVASRLPLPPD